MTRLPVTEAGKDVARIAPRSVPLASRSRCSSVNRRLPDYLKLHLEDAPRGPETSFVEDPRFESPPDAAWQLLDVPSQVASRRPGLAPVISRGADEPRGFTSRSRAGLPLPKRIETLLRTAGELTACDAAAAYLLDDATSQLKLTSTWGRPGRRQSHPVRPLRGQLADLEALLGQAVVVQRAAEAPEWKIPEDCGAAACVPIAGTTPLGTLWIFSQKPRGFTPDQVQMLDVVAGRIAAEVERENLVQESAVLKAWHRHWRRAVEWQQGQRPQGVPLVQGWQLVAATSRSAPLAGGYHDWSLLPDEQMAVAVGQAQGDAVEAQLTVAALHAGLKSHAPYARHAGQLLRRLNDTFWVGSAGDQFTAFAYAMVDPTDGRFEFAAAGPVAGLVVSADRHEVLHGGLHFLGENPDANFEVRRQQLQRGESLVLVHPVPGAYAAREAAIKDAAPLDSALMASLAARPWAGELASRVRELVDVPGAQLSARLQAAWREIQGVDPVEPTLVIVRRDRATP